MITRILATLAVVGCLAAAEPPLDQRWRTRIQPMISTYCLECHSTARSKGGIDLEALRTPADLAKAGTLAGNLLHVVEHNEMPTRKAKLQPTEAERAEIVAWLKAWRLEADKANPDDPGVVVMPRMTREEFAWVARDLTGVTTRAHEQIPGEGGAGEGFTNVGQAHTMTSDQIGAYLAAARALLQQARIAPGLPISWQEAPGRESPTAKDQREQLVAAWGDWHRSEIAGQLEALKGRLAANGIRSLIAGYLEASWKMHHQVGPADPVAAAGAFDPPLMAGPLTRIDAWLQDRSTANAIQAELARRILAIPAGSDPAEVRKACGAAAAWFIDRVEPCTFVQFKPAIEQNADYKAVRISIDSKRIWPLRLVLPAKTAAIHLSVSDCYQPDGDLMRWRAGRITLADGTERPWQDVSSLTTLDGRPVAWGSHAAGGACPAGEVVVHAPSVLRLSLPDGAAVVNLEAAVDDRAGANAAMQVLADLEPPADMRWFLKRRLIGAKDSPEVKRLNNEQGEAAMALLDPHRDTRWKNGYCLTGFGSAAGLAEPDWTLVGAEPDRKARNASLYTPTPSELRAQAAPEALVRLAAIGRQLVAVLQPEHQAMAAFLRRQGRSEVIEGVIPAGLPDAAWSQDAKAEFARLGAAMQAAERQLRESASAQVAAFATRAWRRAPDERERAELMRLFDLARADGGSYDTAVKSALLGVLISPHFLYRAQPARNQEQPYAIAGRAFAERLSFAIWGSIPDDELLRLAADGSLLRREVLAAQVRRMVLDPRGRALAERFMGEWLGFAGFASFTGPDLERFKTFTPELRQAMYDECVLFALDLFRNDRPISDCLTSRAPFLNEVLAKHYGIDGVRGPEMRRVEVTDGRRIGMESMAAFLTKQSTPLRTSPVKRGAWVYKHLLGVELPAPPPVVPRLSDDERDKDGLPIREQLARHRADPACMTCHVKMDPLGIALEQFDPIGRWRTKDLSGSPVVASDKAFDGTQLEGFGGLAAWLGARAQRQTFARGFTRKLLGYALGRGIAITDGPTIERLAGDGTDGSEPGALQLLIGIVDSPQFRNRKDLP